MGWLLAGLAVLAILAFIYSMRDERSEFERRAIDATITHVEREYYRGPAAETAPPLAAPGRALNRVCITYRTEDGHEGQVTFLADEARRFAPHLLELDEGERIVKEAGERWPHPAEPPPPPVWVEHEIGWQDTGDPEMPYESFVDGRHLQLRPNPFPGGHRWNLFVDGEPDGGVDRWPEGWRRGA